MCGTVVERLSVSPRGGVIRLVLSFLEDANLPAVVLQVLAGRDDAKFVEHLVRQTGPEPSPAVAGIFRQVDRIGWARPGHPVWAALDSDGQYNAVRLIAVSSVPREELLAVLADVQATGQPGGRRAAARTLADLKGPAADHLAVRGLKDDDPEVLAHLIPQIRPRGLPDADDLLTALADHPDPRVHAALREALPEFDLRHFLANFDALSTGTRRAQGRVVARIGVNVTGQLAEEIRSFTPERRRRAALAAGVMGVAPQLEENVIHLLADQDQVVRAAAAEALADCPTRAAYEALHTALADRSSMVRAAAERGLARFRDLLDQQAASGASLEEASP
jgi:HEAT repeat protein